MGFMTAEEFGERCGVPRETMDQLNCYSDLLVKWQNSINLVSKKTLEDVWRRHFYDSAQLIDHIEKGNTALNILDVGSGAGFPGLVLSIMGAGKVHLVESNGKKCAFMKQVIQKTGIDAIVHNKRVEKMEACSIDFITSRACADLEKLLSLAANLITPKTECLFLKGEKAEEEIRRASKKWDFKVKKVTSKSEESGMILKLSEIRVY